MDDIADPTLERARLLSQVASQAAEDVAAEMRRFLANAEQRKRQLMQPAGQPQPKPPPDPGPGPWEVAVIQGSALVTTTMDLRKALKRGMVVCINGKEYQIKQNGELSSQRFELAGDYDRSTDFHATLSFPGQIMPQVRNDATPPPQPRALPPAATDASSAAGGNGSKSVVPRSRRFLSKEELPDALSRAAQRPVLHKQTSRATSERSSCITTATRISTSPLRNPDLPPRNAAEAAALKEMKQQQESLRRQAEEERRLMSERAAAEGQKQAKKRAKRILQELREQRELEQQLQEAQLRRRAQAIVITDPSHPVRPGESVNGDEAQIAEEDEAITRQRIESAERARQKALLRVHQRKEEEEAERRRQEELMRQQELERQERSKQLTERHHLIAKRRVAERIRRLKEQQQIEELLQKQAEEERQRAEQERKKTAQLRAMELAEETRRRMERREAEKRRKEEMEQHRIQKLLEDFESSNRRKYLSYVRNCPPPPDEESVQSRSQPGRVSEGRRPSSMRASPLPPLVEPDEPMLRTQSEQKQRPRRPGSRDSARGRRPSTKQFLPRIPNSEPAGRSDQQNAAAAPPAPTAQRQVHDSDDNESVVSDDSIGMSSKPALMNPQDDQSSVVSSITGVSGLKTHASEHRKPPRRKPVRPIWRMLEPIPIKPFVEVPKKDDFSNMRNYTSSAAPSPAS